jgi:hypothetical protein
MKAANPLVPGTNAPAIEVGMQKYLLNLTVTSCGKNTVKPYTAAIVI